MTAAAAPGSPVVVAARRTPVATTGRGLARIDAAGLAAPVLAALRSDLSAGATTVPAAGASGRPGPTAVPDGPAPVTVDEVVLGNCWGPGGNTARLATLAAGLGAGVPAVTVDRQCGSGLEAVRHAVSLIGSGAAEVVLAGGTESASTAPWRLAHPPGPGLPPRAYLRAPFAPPGFPDPDMGAAADDLAERRGIGRDRQDAYAARSHARTTAAQRAGVFDAELVPVAGLDRDDRPREGLTGPVLARFPPAFTPEGTATAGNSCGISDGAGAVAVVSERLRAAAGLAGLRVLATAAVGVDPALPGFGPVPAVRRVLARAGLDLSRVGLVEITEAFAGQVLACTDALGLDPLGADADRVCPDGGAIALGHPWGASGALLLARLFDTMVRRPRPVPVRYGVATCAVGGGQGLAVLVEHVPGEEGAR